MIEVPGEMNDRSLPKRNSPEITGRAEWKLMPSRREVVGISSQVRAEIQSQASDSR